jgi:predicted HicB family RNase H-like nuclease
MAATSLIGARVTPEVKAAFASVAQQQGMSESALLKQLLNVIVARGGESRAGNHGPSMEAPCRGTRFSVRIRPDDRRLLCERAVARSMKPATYVSTLIRSHLKKIAPVPKKELEALMQVINELGAVGRNLNQIARAINQGSRAAGPNRDELRAILKACAGLRDHVRELLKANMESWEVGHDQAAS